MPAVLSEEAADALGSIQRTAALEHRFGDLAKYSAKLYNKLRPLKKALPWLGAALMVGGVVWSMAGLWKTLKEQD